MITSDPFMPDWKNAPEWAMWHAVDEWSEAVWYAACPLHDGDSWRTLYRGFLRRNYNFDYEATKGFDGRNSLRHRPEEGK